jgi:hypothetical protein
VIDGQRPAKQTEIQRGDIAQFIRERVVKWKEEGQAEIPHPRGDPAQHEEDACDDRDIRPEF